jgi:hypothetical protein
VLAGNRAGLGRAQQPPLRPRVTRLFAHRWWSARRGGGRPPPCVRKRYPGLSQHIDDITAMPARRDIWYMGGRASV